MKTTTLKSDYLIPSERLIEIQRELISGDEGKAVLLGNKLGIEMTNEVIATEIEFLCQLESARKKKAFSEYSAWEWLILVALGLDWEQDEDEFHGPYEWNSPMLKKSIVDMASGFYSPGPREDVELAFDVLVEQGLFFQAHPGVFADACYYCEYDSDFLCEIPEFERYMPQWQALQKKLDMKFDLRTWRTTGLCRGGGSQGTSELPLSICVGSSCCRFREGDSVCQHELPFNPMILPVIKNDNQGGAKMGRADGV